MLANLGIADALSVHSARGFLVERLLDWNEQIAKLARELFADELVEQPVRGTRLGDESS